MGDALKAIVAELASATTPLQAAEIALPEGAKPPQPWHNVEVAATPQGKGKAKPVYEFESLRIQRVTRRITKP